MKTINYNKIYLGNREIKSGQLYIGLDKIILKNNESIYKSGHYDVGDAVVYDSDKQQLKVVDFENIQKLDTNICTPVGVVVIPSDHDVYGTGECGVIALVNASQTTPDTGSFSDPGICWGDNKTDHTQLNNYGEVVYSKINKNDTGVAQGVRNFTYLPSDVFSTSACSTDPLAFYKYGNDSPCSPSPYLKDGSRNPVYYQTKSPSSAANALSDFDGKSNTEFLCSKATAQTDWKTASTIRDYWGGGYYPAACACWRYHTIGTLQGDWYLPACGELGYIFVRQKKINETIAVLQSYFSINLSLLIRVSFWSSSESNSATTRSIEFGIGAMNNSGRNQSYYVRPFMRLK